MKATVGPLDDAGLELEIFRIREPGVGQRRDEKAGDARLAGDLEVHVGLDHQAASPASAISMIVGAT